SFDPHFAFLLMLPRLLISPLFPYTTLFRSSVSMPNMLNSVHLDANGYKIGSETQHLFAAAGYVFSISDNFKLKPHTMFKMAFDADRKSTRLNSSHVKISYAVFCLKKKTKHQ